MGISHSEAYAAAGVDIEAGYQGVKMMNRYVQRTLTADVISDLGGFGGLFSLDLHGLEKPVLVSGTDGVGTKQRIAQLMDRHNTVGIDCVAMCVNDIICCGAKPLFFLDYIAIGKNIPEKVVSLVSGVSEGCVRAGCALIGGETAEHPGTMKPDDYDLAGFAVGVVDRGKILDKNKMQPGDVVIALPSSGLHSNGYSLVRKVFDVENADLGQYYGELGCELGEELLRPTICSTPSTWARAWCSSLQRTAPTRRSPRCILSVRRPASSVRSYWARKRWSYADTRPHRRAGLRRRHEFAGAARRAA